MPLGLAEAERVTETEEEAGRIEDVTDGVEVIAEVIEEVMEGVCDTVAVTDGVKLVVAVIEELELVVAVPEGV